MNVLVGLIVHDLRAVGADERLTVQTTLGSHLLEQALIGLVVVDPITTHEGVDPPDRDQPEQSEREDHTRRLLHPLRNPHLRTPTPMGFDQRLDAI